MESYWIGRVAAGQGIPFLAVRAVSDALGDALPDLGGVVDPNGSVHTSRALAALLRHPAQARPILSLAAAARLASRNLATFVEAFVTALPSDHGGNHGRDSL
jgi:hypothetical protein